MLIEVLAGIGVIFLVYHTAKFGIWYIRNRDRVNRVSKMIAWSAIANRDAKLKEIEEMSK